MNKQTVLDRTILMALTGSRAYGIHNPESDSDYKGICIATKPYYLGFSKFEQMDKGWEGTESPYDYLGRDTVVYEIRKFFSLATDNNPNILDMFYSPEYRIITPIGEQLLSHRDMFISKQARYKFAGYAYAQAKKIETHRKWLLNPPSHEPTLEEYGLSDDYRLKKDELRAFLEFLYQLIRNRIEYIEEAEILDYELSKMIQGDIDIKQALVECEIPDEAMSYAQKLTGASDNYIQLLQKTHSYNTAKKHWDNYQSWKKNRNPDRAGMEAKIGYDTKHAGHLIRLMRMGCEILQGKGVIVDRRIAGDAEEIRYIRNGYMKYDDLMVEFNRLELQLEDLYKSSTLQHSPPKDKIERLCIELIEEFGL